eukprot:500529-Hanusia_phi.AAC.1
MKDAQDSEKKQINRLKQIHTESLGIELIELGPGKVEPGQQTPRSCSEPFEEKSFQLPLYSFAACVHINLTADIILPSWATRPAAL